MALVRFGAEGIRNLEAFNIEIGPDLNILTGANGAGKTSLLEAIFLLSSGRSFRTSTLSKVVNDSAKGFRIVSKVHTTSSHQTLSMQRQGARLTLSIDGNRVDSLSLFARSLPVISISSDSHKLIEEGPSYRRRFLDWAVFHVEQANHKIWTNYANALKQRNAALRQGLALSSISIWDDALCIYGEQINTSRAQILSHLSPLCTEHFRALGYQMDLSFSYSNGIPEGEAASIREALHSRLDTDINRGFTSVGPHRADLRIQVNNKDVRERLSRGQQKILTTSMLLSLATLYQSKHHHSATVLIDDLPSELDATRRQALLSLLHEGQYQTIITAIQAQDLPDITPTDRLFHVEHGTVNTVV